MICHWYSLACVYKCLFIQEIYTNSFKLLSIVLVFLLTKIVIYYFKRMSLIHSPKLEDYVSIYHFFTEDRFVQNEKWGNIQKLCVIERKVLSAVPCRIRSGMKKSCGSSNCSTTRTHISCQSVNFSLFLIFCFDFSFYWWTTNISLFVRNL